MHVDSMLHDDIELEPRVRQFYYVTKGRNMASADREPIWGLGESSWWESGGLCTHEADKIS